MDKYEKLKYNPKFLKKAYDLVKEDFPKLFRDDNNYTEEDEKNWDIALDKIYNNFVTPEEQDFIEIWGETDGTIGLLDHIYQNKNQFESFGESTNKYIQAFREAVEKLQEENAATKHFRGDTESNRQSWGKGNLISDANEIFASIEHFLAEYDMSNSQEYKTNSQAARVYKMIEKMRDIIPYTYGADAYNSDMGNKDLVDPIYDNEGDVITAKWRY